MTTSVQAAPSIDGDIVVNEVTNDVDTLYERYQDNSFELLTQELEKRSITGIKETFVNLTGTAKNFIWGLVKGLGQFNAAMVKYLFQLDIVSSIKEPFLQMTSSIASNMLSIAGSIGISFVALVMVIRFIGEQRFKQAIRLFAMTILIFVGLVTLRDANTRDSLFTTLFEIDQTVETSFVKVNPVLSGDNLLTIEENSDEADDRIADAGELIASRIFFTNVYEPYLLMNYGTTNMETIREQQVEYEGTTYDRINILLDNDIDIETNEELHQAVADYEADELENKTIMYFNNLKNMTFALFYLVVNLIQTLVYFIMCFVRVIVAFLQLLFLPLMPFLLLVGMFMPAMNVFANYFKGFGMTIFFKGMIGFACIFFASYLSLGFQLSSTIDDPWQKILTILIYLLVPLGLYIFRTFIGGLFTNRVSLSDALAVAANPIKAQQTMRQQNKERRQEQKRQRQQEKARKAAQLQERQKKAENEGRRDLGLKQANVNQQPKQSLLRRERQEKGRHHQLNPIQRMQSSVAQRHDQAKAQERKEVEQLRERTQQVAQERARVRAVKQTEVALKASNQQLTQSQQQANAQQSVQMNKENQVRRMGTSSRKLQAIKQEQRQNQPSRASVHRAQGKKNTEPKQNQKNLARSLNRQANHSESTQSKSKAKNRSTLSLQRNQVKLHAHSNARRPIEVRQKMNATQQVIAKQNQRTVRQTQPKLSKNKQENRVVSAQKNTPKVTRTSQRQRYSKRIQTGKINKQTVIRRQIKQKEGKK